jgi:hypothetical protein
MSGSGTMSGSESDLKGHQSDQVLMGKVSKVSKKSLSIRSDQGERHTLVVVPETLITVDGQEGKISDIKQGQEIRASYNELQGRNVAVKIEAGESMGGSSSTGSSSGMSGSSSGTSSDSPGSTGSMSGSSGTTGAPSDTGAATSGSSGTGTTGSTSSGTKGSETSGSSSGSTPETGTGK